jgi:hypothetical protein
MIPEGPFSILGLALLRLPPMLANAPGCIRVFCRAHAPHPAIVAALVVHEQQCAASNPIADSAEILKRGAGER